MAHASNNWTAGETSTMLDMRTHVKKILLLLGGLALVIEKSQQGPPTGILQFNTRVCTFQHKGDKCPAAVIVHHNGSPHAEWWSDTQARLHEARSRELTEGNPEVPGLREGRHRYRYMRTTTSRCWLGYVSPTLRTGYTHSQQPVNWSSALKS